MKSKQEKIEEYQAAVQTVALCARMIGEHDLPELLAAIEHADAIGPILDPTLWRDRHGAMHEDKEVLEAGLPLYRLAQKVRANYMQKLEEVAAKAEAGV
jgi:hypothetical protein